MFSNHGDRRMNKRVLEKLGYQEFYADIDKDFVVLSRLRVCTKIFHENT